MSLVYLLILLNLLLIHLVWSFFLQFFSNVLFTFFITFVVSLFVLYSRISQEKKGATIVITLVALFFSSLPSLKNPPEMKHLLKLQASNFNLNPLNFSKSTFTSPLMIQLLMLRLYKKFYKNCNSNCRFLLMEARIYISRKENSQILTQTRTRKQNKKNY